MKTRIYFIVFSIVFFSMPFAKAESDKDYTDRKFRERFEPFRERMERNIGTINSNVDVYDKRFGDIDKSLKELESTMKQIQSAVDSLSKRVNGPRPIGSRPLLPTWALFVVIVVCVIILVFVILLFWPRGKALQAVSPDSSSRPKCPCCGMEHDPDDTVCKNPNCKTQF